MRLFVIAILLIAISGCTSEEDSIKRGEVLFNKKHLGKNRVIGCVACHSIEPDQVIVGPSLAGLSIRAPHLVADQSAQEYIRETTLNPEA